MAKKKPEGRGRTMHDLKFTQHEMAEIIGVNKSTFTRWKLPHEKQKNRNLYYAPEILKHPTVIKVLVSRYGEDGTAMEKARIKLLQEQAKKTTIETKTKKLEYEEKRGKLIEPTEMIQVVELLILAAREALLGLADEIITELADEIKSPNKVQTVVTDIVREALEGLANYEQS